MSSLGVHGGAAGGGGTPSDPSEVNIIEYGSAATSLGQKAMAASIPVVVASDQTAVPVSISGTVQVDVTDEPTRDLGKVDVASLDQYTPVSGRLPVDGSGVTQPVSGTFFQATQPISAASLPLPTGAATSALQTQPGVDIGDVTVNNGAGASAVNIQDGGNSITVDGTVTANAGTDLNTSALLTTAAHDAAFGTAGSADAQVRSVQGIAGGVALPIRASFATRADTFTATGNGVTVDRSTSPLKAFGIQVKGTGAAPTTWDVRLEGSLDNANFSTILTHTNTTGDGVVLWTGAVLSPLLYFRSRVAGLVLGPATNIVVTIIGTE